jgi:hypothetical protein
MGLSQSEERQINERFQQLEAKVTALQFMFCENLAAQYLMAGITPRAMDKNHKALRAIFEKLRFKKLSAAESDDWADAIQQAMAALLTQIEKSYRNRAG